jgi:hypothetical protein
MGLGFFLLLFFASALILAASLMVSSSFVGGIEFGPAHVALAKGALLLAGVNLVALVPSYGVWLTLPVWWLGLVLLFRVDFFAAWLPVSLCFVPYLVVFFLLRLALGTGPAITTVPG